MIAQSSILLVGGAGYIGSHCCKALAESGFIPVCFDNLSTGHLDFVKWGPFVRGDIVDTAAVEATIKGYNIQSVVHFAAFSAVGESVSQPQKYYDNNVAGTLSLLRGMRSANCDKLVFSSTGAVYGNAGCDPIRESSAGHAVNPYGRSKWMIEQILGDFREAYRLRSICLRYFNACGADSLGEIGELREQETHLIPRAFMALQGHLTDFAIFGDDYDTPDGTAIRDYIHVTDLARAHVLAVQSLLGGSDGGSFNLGTGAGYSVKQVLASIAHETGRMVPVLVRGRRSGDPPVLVADPSAAEKTLGFRTEHSELSEIVRSAWTWHRKAHPFRAV